MSGINIYGLSERKRHIAGDYGRVDCVPEFRDTCFGESRNDLLNITDPLSTSGWASRATPVPQINVYNKGQDPNCLFEIIVAYHSCTRSLSTRSP